MSRRLLLIVVLLAGLAGESITPRYHSQQAPSVTPSGAGTLAARGLSPDAFARLSRELSEPGGYFDTDNLISNEASYLHVLGKLRKLSVQGGAYIGVGPDQNFSYIAQIRPQIVYIVDIRRDNLLQHLLFKALFSLSRNRVEYLALLFGKPMPADPKAWDSKTLQQVIDHIDKSPSQRERFDATKAAIARRIKEFGVNLNEADLTTVGR